MLLLSFLLPFHVNSNENHVQIEKEVLASFQSLVQASKDLDAKAYFAHFNEEKFVGLNSDGTNWNSINDLRPLITNGFAAIKEITLLTFTNVKVSVVNEQTAILVNEYIQSMELKNGSVVSSAGGGTQVWSKDNGSWKIVSVSASNAP
jgi:ketosteroid isomerase-like protein